METTCSLAKEREEGGSCFHSHSVSDYTAAQSRGQRTSERSRSRAETLEQNINCIYKYICMYVCICVEDNKKDTDLKCE